MARQTRPLAVGLGEVLFDVIEGKPHLGGAPANFAWHCHELGLRAAAVSAVGEDPLGDEAIRLLADAELAEGIERIAYPTGRVDVTVDEKGCPRYEFLEDTAYDHLPLSARQLEIARTADIVCFGTLCQRTASGRAAVNAFLDAVSPKALKIFDVNLRKDYWSYGLIEEGIKRCDILKLNEDEFEYLPDVLVSSYYPDELYDEIRARYGLRGMVLTNGGLGSTVYWGDYVSSLDSLHVKVADTVGAGDSFIAALAAGLTQGLPLADAHRLAVEVSARVCSASGAMVHLPEKLRLIP